MDNVVLIACCNQKDLDGTRASTVYASPLFRKSLAWAELQHPKAIYVLSALFGLVGINDEMGVYDFKMPTAKRQREIWTEQVLFHLKILHDFKKTHFTILAGRMYREFLTEHLPHHSVPLRGLGIGQQQQALKQWIDEASI